MEEIIDKLIAEVGLWSQADVADGGIADFITINSVYFGDPGILPVYSYPAVTVQAAQDQPESETTGYENFDHSLIISILIDAREFFDASVEEATGDRQLVKAASSLRRWLRRDSNRTLDSLSGVRQLKVETTDYVPEVRGEVITKSAQLTLVVNKQYQRQK